MAFTVETGAGVAGANAYVTTAYADSHHADRGNSAWAGMDSVKQAAIIRATDYVDKRFGPRFRGFRQSKSQGLEWPRLSAFDNDDFLLNDVPEALQKAVAEYALIALNLALSPLPALPFATRDPSTGTVTSTGGGQVLKARDKVGPVETEREFADTASLSTRKKPSGAVSSMVSAYNLPEYPIADDWLQELMKPGFSTELRRG